MRKKTIISIISLILVTGLAACSTATQTAVTAEPTDSNQVDESQPAENNISEEPSPEAPEANTPATSLSSLQTAYENIYDEVLPSVVSIEVTATVTQTMPSIPDFPFNFEFPNEDGEGQEYQQSGEGSGFVWDTEGHIITNNHVVNNADTIRVRFADGTSVLGEVVGTDSASDLAVVKVNVPASKLKPIKIADSTKVKVGQIVVAIGNPFRLNSSMTTGIVSGLGRSLALDSSTTVTYTIPDVIQTDAAINPGNSGGVLVDINSALIGVTTAIQSPVEANAGVGYVVPSIIVQKIVPFLIEDGFYQQPYIGISGSDLTPELAEAMNLDSTQRGALVFDVNPDTPAEEAGLQGSDRTATVDGQETRIGGDVIISADGMAITDFEDLTAFLARYTNVGQTIELTYIRDGEEQIVPLTLAARPGEATETRVETREVGSNAWLGINGMDLTRTIATEMGLNSNQQGALVQQITSGSPADEAGLRGSYKPFELNGEEVLIGGDVIIAVDNTDITGINDLASAIGTYEPGDEITLTILRDANEINVDITLAEKP
jgi:S1-C subfamily serine protease